MHKDDVDAVMKNPDGRWTQVRVGDKFFTGQEAAEIQREIESKGGLDEKRLQLTSINEPFMPQPSEQFPHLPALKRPRRKRRAKKS